jgi:hypothetical protein
LRQSQRDHERATADHGVTVRELQTLVSTERNKFESMEHQVIYIIKRIFSNFDSNLVR